MIISKFPRGSGSSGEEGGSTSAAPVYTYTGEHAFVMDEDGNWDLRLTSSGTLTLANRITAVIQGQGAGGAGGAGYASGSGSDGADGSIESLEVTLEPGEYVISIGAAGAKSNNAAGGAGGGTSFGDLLTAAGGAGGAYKGGENVEHSGLYDTYGHGGEGGTPSQYSTSTTGIQWYVVSNKATYRYASTDITSEKVMSMSAGVNMYVGWGATAPTTITGTDGNQWWKQENGYLLASDFGSPVKTGGDTTYTYYGNAGNPGIVIISNKRKAA